MDEQKTPAADSCTTRTSKSRRSEGIVERLRDPARWHDSQWRPKTRNELNEAADLLDEIREHLSKERFRLVEEEHDFVGAMAVRKVLGWLDEKLEGK